MADMVSADKAPEGAATMEVGKHVLVQEMACSYKAVRASQYISDAVKAIGLSELLEKLAQQQRISQKSATSLAKAHDLKEYIDTTQVKLNEGGIHERDVKFVEQDLEKKRAAHLAIMADVIQEQSTGDTGYYMLLADALPVIFQEAPELIYNFCALMMIPNSDLPALYKKTNGIAERVEKNKQWLMFEVDTWLPLEIADFFLPCMGLNVLKKALSSLIGTATETLFTTTGTLPSSSSPNSLSASSQPLEETNSGSSGQSHKSSD